MAPSRVDGISRATNADYDREVRAAAQDFLDALAAEEQLDGVVVAAGSVGEGLHHAARVHHADLVVIGSGDPSPMRRLLSGEGGPK